MILEGSFVFISAEKRESNGKKYFNVNLEAEDGQLLRVGTEEHLLTAMEKYKKYTGFFTVGSFNNQLYMRLSEVRPFASK